jgi:ribonuclease P protein component
MALPKSHRLSLRFERDRLNQTGQTKHGKFFTLVVAKTPEEKLVSPRFAILLSKKTSPLAINRNKIKRITSDIIVSLLNIFPKGDFLIIPKKQVLTEDYKGLLEDIKNLI